MKTSLNEAPANGIIAVLLGFFGVTAVFLLLPKTIKFFLQKFVLGVFFEIIAVVVTGLLSEKLVDMIGRDTPSEAVKSRP
jgi:hypothetical protein